MRVHLERFCPRCKAPLAAGRAMCPECFAFVEGERYRNLTEARWNRRHRPGFGGMYYARGGEGVGSR